MNNCKYCKADCALRGEENLKECKGHIPMSNADRIRAMSDEELAVWIASIRLDPLYKLCKKFDVEIEISVPTVENTTEIREWLQQPVETLYG